MITLVNNDCFLETVCCWCAGRLTDCIEAMTDIKLSCVKCISDLRKLKSVDISWRVSSSAT